MNLLWITNILFPPVYSHLHMTPPVTGGWMYSSAKQLINKFPDVHLAVAAPFKTKVLRKIELDNITYYLLPINDNAQYNKKLEPIWQTIKKEFSPDIIHIHGTEYPHGLSYINSCGPEKVVISIQGFVSVYTRYYYGDISKYEILKHISIRDVIKHDSLINQRHKFSIKGGNERKAINAVKNVIGRTEWDRAHVWAINPRINYYHCNETLRDVFYKHAWKYEFCIKHSIFLSQAGYPIKGLHKVIEAVALVSKLYPDISLVVAGNDIIHLPWYRITGYGRIIKDLIHRKNLSSHIRFTGLLNEQEICNEYLKANVFICPSSIENSPNSLGEAQILGVPYLASYVGGSPDMANCNFLYRFEEVEMLAYKICDIFNRNNFDVNDRQKALDRHDPDKNADNLMCIYHKIK